MEDNRHEIPENTPTFFRFFMVGAKPFSTYRTDAFRHKNRKEPMPRLVIPHNALQHIAEKLIVTDRTVKRTATKRPRSKTAMLKDLMKSDAVLFGRVMQMYKQMETDKLKKSMEKSGLSMKPESDLADAAPFFKNWTPEERRAWRLSWACEFLRDGKTAYLAHIGGSFTPEELALARATLDGAPIPPELQGIGAFAEFEANL
jgi:hypothetical protein